MKTVHEVEIGVPPEEVWPGLTEAGRTGWYFNLTPTGSWAPGDKVEWRFSNGSVAEESTVREADRPRRLVLETRMLWNPTFAEAPPYIASWELEPLPGGTRVRVTREFDEGAANGRTLAAERGHNLRGLRLEVDPAARAEIARLETVGAIEVRDVTRERVADYLSFFDNDAFRDFPSWQFCYCAEPIFAGDDEEWAGRTPEDNRRDISRMLATGETTGLLAYADGKPVGWCHYGRTTRFVQLMKRYELEAASQAGVGSVACFVITPPYRGHGVATALLETACDRLAAAGLEWVEAYPRKEGERAQAHFRGPLSMYVAAGFQPYRETDSYVVVRKSLR